MSTSVSGESVAPRRAADVTTFSIILALSFSHFLNDTMQSLVPAIYPMLKGSYGLSFAQIGLITLTMQVASSVLLAATLVGAGSAVFHPEASRVARMASGGRHGLAQSLFQVGGNAGSALGPILAALIVIPKGQGSIGWFSAAALLAMVVLFAVGNWHLKERAATVRPWRAHQ